MKHSWWKVKLSLGLMLLSALLYFLHYLIFHDAGHIFLYLLGDIAFIPIDVLLVVLVLHGIITYHEKQQMLKKLNMVFGAFFSEAGTELLRRLTRFDLKAEELKGRLILKKEWRQEEFTALRRALRDYPVKLDAKKGDLPGLRGFLISKREFLLRLLENPNLLEHEDFTSLLWAVFHLAEELASRQQVDSLPDSDYEHLSGDIQRVYGLLLLEWIAYMKHLHKEYPFLFSLAMRTNPFDAQASVVIK
jgi:hypothetical protein